MPYKIIRFYENDHDPDIIATGLTLRAAQRHCKDPETSSETAQRPDAVKRTAEYGRWFHGYEAE